MATEDALLSARRAPAREVTTRHRVGGCVRHHASLTQLDDRFGALSEVVRVMRDQHHRQREAALRFEEVGPQPEAQRRIQRRERLVEQQQRRARAERSCQRRALPLAARELPGIAFANIVQREKREKLVDFVVFRGTEPMRIPA